MLDATAFVASVYHRDRQGVRALLDANRSSPQRLESFSVAVAILVIRAMEDCPPCGVDEALAQVRRAALEQR
jgi:hypothetical protein